MKYITTFIKRLFNSQSLIIKFFNNSPFKLDTKLTINTDSTYIIKHEDYLYLVNLIKNIIINAYSIDNNLNIWKITFTYINNDKKVVVSNTYLHCLSIDKIYHIDTKIFNDDIKIIIDDNATLTIDIINVPIDSNHYRSIILPYKNLI